MRLLLHVCCGPDVTVALERLPETERLTLFFDNPNIHPLEEYTRRLETFKRVASYYGADYLIGEYNPQAWHQQVQGHEGDPEGEGRCHICIGYRLERTAQKASEDGFDTIGSVFSTSPHKHADEINEMGVCIAEKRGLSYLVSDFKKKDGFKRSVQISRQLGLYRQNYCGCIYSMRGSDENNAER
jgi:predicted adenine nucleotide alpha hydrolase (AANH) superfamily ATPase